MCIKKACIFLLFPILLTGLFLESGCSSSRESRRKPGDKVTIGLSMDTLKEERWYKDEIGFVSEAKKRNADVIVDIAYEDSQKQNDQVKELVAKGIDVLVMIAHDDKSAASAVAYAKKNGVKVICYDRIILNANADLYISFDNEKVGELQASTLLKAAGSGNYVIVNGPANDYNTVMIDQGIRKVLSPYVSSGKIKIVKQMEAPNWMADEAYNCITSLKNQGMRINAVIAQNDGLAGGAIDALSENRLIPSVPVVGMDADLAACQRVVEGQQLMTVYKPIDRITAVAADCAVKMALNEKIEVSDQIFDGTYKIPYYKIEPIAVTNSNMNSTVIKDGFHTVNEVYMNIPESERPSTSR